MSNVRQNEKISMFLKSWEWDIFDGEKEIKNKILKFSKYEQKKKRKKPKNKNRKKTAKITCTAE